MTDFPEVLDVDGLIKFLGVKTKWPGCTVRRMARTGKIPCFMIGREYRFSKTAVLKCMERRRV